MSGTYPVTVSLILSCIQIQGLNHITKDSEGSSHSYVTNNCYRTLCDYVSNVGWPAHVAGLLVASAVPFCAQSGCSCYTLLSWQTWASHHAGTQLLFVSHPAQCSSWLSADQWACDTQTHKHTSQAQTYTQTYAWHVITSLIVGVINSTTVKVSLTCWQFPSYWKSINSPHFIELKVSLLHPQQPATCPCPVWYASGFTGPLRRVHGHPWGPRPSRYKPRP